MKKSLFKVIIIITTLLMVAGCPDPVKGQKPSSGNRPTGGSTSPSAAATVNYTVKHMKQNVSGNGYTEDADARQTLSGRAGASTAAQTRSFTGFTAQTFSQTTIAADGSTVVTINYNRNVHTVSYSATTSGVTAPTAASYRFGAQVTVEFPDGITAWRYDGTTYSSSNNTFTMPDSDVILSEVYMISSNNVAETLSALGSNNADTPYSLIVSDSADLAAITEAISSSSIYVTLSLEDCEGLTSLPDDAFAGCDNLTSLVIPETVTSVGSNVFSGCTSLESVSFAGNVDSDVVTDIIASLPSGAVIEAADTTALTSVVQGINSASSSVSLSLEHCTGLTSLSDNAFQGCDNLTSITLPDSLESIGNNAFEGCTGLSSIAIPETVTSVGTGVFTGCSNLDTVSFAGNVDSDAVTAIINGIPQNTVIEAADTDALTSVIQGINSASCNVSLSLEGCEGLTSLSDNAFQGCDNLTNVTLPDNLESIGNNAFEGCAGLESIVIPDSVTSVGTGVFNRCTNIESVTLPGTLNQTSIQNALSSLPTNNAGSSYDIEVTNITNSTHISNLKTAISNSGKYVDLSLENCDGLTTLDDNAFQDCNNLASITLPASVTSISNTAFSGCSDLVSINVPAGNSNYSSANGVLLNSNGTTLICCPEGKTSVSVPSTVTSIGNNAFNGCTGLESIVIPDSVTSVGTGVFNGCTNIESVTLPGTLNQTSIQNALSSLPTNNADSSYDIEVTNSSQISHINAAIKNSGNYVDLSLENCTGLNSLPFRAFINCNKVTSITIPSSVTSIGESAFSNCSSLESITIPNSVTSIGLQTFWYCSSLETIVIPDSVTSIGKNAFAHCSGLESITIPSFVTSIGEGTFYGCTSLQSITIPDSVISIGRSAFYGCTSLESIVIPSSVTSIDDNAFSGCTSLESIVIPSSVTYIGPSAFLGCTSLESITIPTSITDIWYQVFYDCSALQNITLPDSVTYIAEGAFTGCSALQTITFQGTTTQWNSISIESGWNYNCSEIKVECTNGTITVPAY